MTDIISSDKKYPPNRHFNMPPKTVIVFSSIVFLVGFQLGVLWAESSDKLSLGMDMFNHQLFSLSAQQFREYIHQNPTASNLDLAQFYLARCYQSLGNYQSAIKEFHSLLITYPGSSLVDAGWLELSRCYIKIGKEDKAESALKKALSYPMKKEVNLSAHSELGVLLYRKGDYAQAVKVYLHLLEAKPDASKTAWERYRLSQVYIAQGDYPNALTQLRFIAESETHSLLTALANYYSAQCSYVLGDLDEAEEILLNEDFSAEITAHKLYLQAGVQAVKEEWTLALNTLDDLQKWLESTEQTDSILNEPAISPDDIAIISAWLHYKLGDFISAEGELAEVYSQTEDEETKAETLFTIAYLSYQRKNYPFAVDYFAKFASDYPSHKLSLQAVYYQGWCHYKMGDYQEAGEIFSLLLTENPSVVESPYFAFLVGECEFKSNNFHNALEAFNLFTESYPQSTLFLQGLVRRADCLFNLGKNEEAINIYTSFIEQYPHSDITPLAYWNLGRAYGNMGMSAKMREVYNQFILQFPEHNLTDDSALAIVKSLYLETEFEKCISQANNFIEQLTQTEFLPDIYWYKGKSMYDLSRYESAQKVFKYVSKTYADTSAGQDALYYTYLTDHKLGKYTDPLSASSAFLKDHPQSPLAPRVKILVAKYYADEREFLYAISLLKDILKKEIDVNILAEATQELVNIYKRQGMFIDAAEAYVALAEKLKKSSSRYDYLLLSAELYMQGELAEEAIDIYQILLDEIPNDPRISTVLYNLGLIYKDLRLFESAQVMLDKLVKEWPGSNEYILGCFQLAFVYQYLGDLPKAINYHKIVVANASAEIAVQSMYWIGKSYYDLHDYDSARSWLKELAREYPSSTAWVNKANELLKKI